MREYVLSGLKRLLEQAMKAEVIGYLKAQSYKRWCRRWRSIVPKAVACLERDIEDLLVFYHQDPKLWVKIRTTNVIERLFKEVRRRTRVMSIFADVGSCERITYALLNKYNNKWKERRYVMFK